MDNPIPSEILYSYGTTFCQSKASNDDDQLQPSQEQLECALAEARAYWCNLAEQAMSHGVYPHHFNLQSMLNRVPAIPQEPGRICTYFTSTDQKAMSIKASSTWQVITNDSCGINAKERIVRADLRIGIQQPTKYRLTGDSFCNWPQADDQRQNVPNYLGVLALGWSYVLSARLIETQGQEGATIVYTNSTAAGYHSGAEDELTTAFPLSIGDVDADAARWWAAILAPNQGWNAIISQRGRETYQAPWSVSLDVTQRFSIKWRTSESPIHTTININPPSSYEAILLLANFSSLHNLGNQFSAAFATTLTLPTHNYYGTIATLPFPSQARDYKENTSMQRVDTEWLKKELPYYMALSCCPSVVMSSLCGVFWDTNVSCNLVSPWLHSILYEIPNGIGIANVPGRYHEVLAFICAKRCPSLSALWLGAAIGGLVSRVLKFVESGIPPLDHNAFPWTGCPQSFMDVPGLGPYFIPSSSNEDITRADVWQILYLPSVVDDDLHYEHRPFAPWKPVGRINENSCDLRVRAHQNCQKHDLSYQHWNWTLKEGSIVKDQGFKMTVTEGVLSTCSLKDELLTDMIFPTVPLSTNQNASQNASRTILQWVTINGEGVPPEEIYQDEWVRDFLQDIDDNDDDDDMLSDTLSVEAAGLDATNHRDSE